MGVLQEVLGAAGMGHNNPRQKIQYHLAVRSQFPVPGRGQATAQGGGQSRSPLEKNPVQPASLRRHHLYATPVSRRSLMLAGRGKQALQEGQAWQSKEEMEAAIENATQQTAQDLHMLLDQAQGPSPSAGPLATPLGKENMAAPAGSGDTKKRAAAGAAPLSMLALQGTEGGAQMTPAPEAARFAAGGAGDLDSLETRIWAHVKHVCSPSHKGRISTLVKANGGGRPPTSTPLPPAGTKRNPFDDSSNATARRLAQAGWGVASSSSSRASSESGRNLASARSASSVGH